MQIPEVFQGPSLTRLLQGAGIGMIATLAVGFGWFGGGLGWYTNGSAQEMARTSTSDAVIAALSPICAQNFKLGLDADKRLAALTSADSWKRGDMIKDAGFANFTGSADTTRGVAEGCVKILMQPAKT